MNERVSRWWMAVAGLCGCLLIAVEKTRYSSGFTPQLGVAGPDAFYGTDPYLPLIPVVATVLALCLLRWWPYLLVAGGLLCVPVAWPAVAPDVPATNLYWYTLVFYLLSSAYPLLVVGTLGAAQSLIGTRATGLGAAVAGLVVGAGFFGQALVGVVGLQEPPGLSTWRIGLVVTGLAAIVAAIVRWRGDPAATGPPGVNVWRWRRLRLIIAGGVAVFAALEIAMITADRLAGLLDVSWRTLVITPNTRAAILGGLTLAVAITMAALAGLWALAGSLAAATVQIAVAVPVTIAIAATSEGGPVRWFGVLVGVAIGAAAAMHRWRTIAATIFTVGAATALFIAYAATSGEPDKLAAQHRVVPALVLIVLVTAATTATVGGTAPVLAARGAIPAVLGPITGVLVVAGVQTAPVIWSRTAQPPSLTRPSLNLDAAGVLLLLAAAAIGGLGIAQYLSERWAERKRAELIRQEAAAAERDRLSRPIHDGVLQVLALVQRQGAELGASGTQLAALAGEQEAALRNLLSGTGAVPNVGAESDVRITLYGLASPVVDVSGPAEAVLLPATSATEVVAAVQAALDNVRRHAGPDARAWILLEDEDDGVRVTVRDNGVGFEADRLQDAVRSGRLGVEQSIRGRIRDLGGTTVINSRPGKGTEVELWIPRRR